MVAGPARDETVKVGLTSPPSQKQAGGSVAVDSEILSLN